MLYLLLPPLTPWLPILNVTRYITFRTAAASITALLLGLFLGPWMIRKLQQFQIGQVIRHEGPATHRTKAGTPTMGGLLILTSTFVPTLLWELRVGGGEPRRLAVDGWDVGGPRFRPDGKALCFTASSAKPAIYQLTRLACGGYMRPPLLDWPQEDYPALRAEMERIGLMQPQREPVPA